MTTLTPRKWNTVKLGEIVELITKGTTPSTIGKSFIEKGVNFIKSESITREGFIDPSTFAHIDEETHELLKRSIIKEKDILFSIAGIYLAKSGVVKKEHLPANTNQAVAIIRLKHNLVNYRFIKFLFQSDEFVQMIYGFKGQAAQPNISLGDLKSLDLDIPSLPIQNQIASVLSAYDDSIENNNRRIKILEETAQKIYTEWFVNFRFPGHEKVKMVNSGTEFGMIPEGWAEVNLDTVANIQFGYNYKADGFNESGKGAKVVRIRDILSGDSKTFSEEKVDKKYIIQVGDVLIGMDGIFHMKIWPEKNCNLVQRVASIHSSLPSQFLLESIKTQLDYLQKTIMGSTVAHLSNGNVREFKILIPDNRQCLSIFEDITIGVVSLQAQNKILKKSRDLLIPQLVSGKLGVK